MNESNYYAELELLRTTYSAKEKQCEAFHQAAKEFQARAFKAEARTAELEKSNKTLAAMYRKDILPAMTVLDIEESLRAKSEKLKSSLLWALEEIEIGGLDHNRTPIHDCEFDSNPEAGYCRFHDIYWTAKSLLGQDPENISDQLAHEEAVITEQDAANPFDKYFEDAQKTVGYWKAKYELLSGEMNIDREENKMLKKTLLHITQIYDARSELATNDADLAQNLAGYASMALNKL